MSWGVDVESMHGRRTGTGWRRAAQAGIAGGAIGLVALVPLIVFFALSINQSGPGRGSSAAEAFGTANDALNLVSALLLVPFVAALWHALPGRSGLAGRALLVTGIALQVGAAAASLATITGRWGGAAVTANGVAVVLIAAWTAVASRQAGRVDVLSRRLALLGMVAGVAVFVGALLFGLAFALPRSMAIYLQVLGGVPGFLGFCAVPLWAMLAGRQLSPP